MEHHFFRKPLRFVLPCLFCFSCVNDLPFDNPEGGSIPVNLSTRVKLMDDDTEESSFDENDTMGLYIIVQPGTFTDNRYTDNMKFTYSGTTGFVPAKTVFYPEGEYKSDFYAYYPYRKEALPAGKSTMEVSVKTDQSALNSYVESDFLVARSMGLSATESPVDLLFEHKLCCINIFLEAGDGYSLEALLADDPEIEITDVSTKATYDFKKNDFLNSSDKDNILPYGEWKIEGEKLCGKTAIIVPQTIVKDHSLMTITISGRTFECVLNKEYNFASGSPQDYTAIISSSTEVVICSLNASVLGWGEPKHDYIDTKEVSSPIKIADLNFAKSGVYKVFNEEVQVAEICKEYLLSTNIKSQAIVAYPVKDGVTDHQKGLLVKMMSSAPANNNGGSVVWNKSDNSLTYTEGSSPAIEYIYVTAKNEIVTARPDNVIQLQLKPDVLIDTRGSETKTYPVVKIGTQYWMGANLQASKYRTGSNITKGKDFITTQAKYCQPNTYSYFYNVAAMATGEMEPEGWRISNVTDWNLLIEYINNDASVLKNGSTWSDPAYPVLNTTGFNASAMGFYNETHKYINKFACYWCAADANPKVAEKSLLIGYMKNETEEGYNKNTLGLSIRCVRN